MKRKITLFFWLLLSWTTLMSFGRIITGQELKAKYLAIIIYFGVFFAFMIALALHISEKSRR
jgi:hypothetical protein